MSHAFIFSNITIINIYFYIKKNHNKNPPKSISLFFHIYFCILSTFILKDEDLVQCATIYFTADSILNTYFNTFKTFNKFHHLFSLIILLFNKNIDRYILNCGGILEFSTIILCMIDLNIINKYTFEILFPLSFVGCRLIVFNYYILTYIYINFSSINLFTIIIYTCINIMNFGITIKMRLVQKIVKLFL